MDLQSGALSTSTGHVYLPPEGRNLFSCSKHVGSCIVNITDAGALWSMAFTFSKERPFNPCPLIAIILHPGLRYGDIAAGFSPAEICVIIMQGCSSGF